MVSPCQTKFSHLDLFSGIGGFHNADTVLSVEIDEHCRNVQRFHYPELEFLDDVRKVRKSTVSFRPEIITGGFPCQDLSVAGKRAGLAGKRSGLWRQFARIIARFKPQWVVIENVSGLLSSNNGLDLYTIYRWLAQRNYWFASRVLDSQYWGVAQRRRRVFIVASLGSPRCIEVLFESEGLPWNPKKGRAAGQGFAADVAPSLNASGRGVSRAGESRGQYPVIACTITSKHQGGSNQMPPWNEADNLIVARESGQGYWMEDDRAGPLRCEGENRPSRPSTILSFQQNSCEGLGTLGIDKDTKVLRPIKPQSDHQFICFSCKDNGRDASEKAPTIRSMTHDKSHLNGGGQLAVAFTERSRKYGRNFECQDKLAYALTNPAAGGRSHSRQIFYQEKKNAKAFETNPTEILRILRKEIGEEAFTEWAVRILVSFFSSEILRQALHECGFQYAPFKNGSWMVNVTLPRKADRSKGAMFTMREAQRIRYSSCRWEPPKQFCEQLGAYLSELSQPGPQAERFMHDLWQAGEGIRILRKALSKIQKMGKPVIDKGESIQRFGVRRLVPVECEFLQGFPRNWTAWGRKRDGTVYEVSDSQRYKMLGNAVTRYVATWILNRIKEIL